MDIYSNGFETIVDLNLKFEPDYYEDYIISLDYQEDSLSDDLTLHLQNSEGLENKSYHELKPVSFENAECLIRQEMIFNEESVSSDSFDFQCDMCYEHFPDEESLRNHCEDSHETTDSDSNSYQIESYDDDSNSQSLCFDIEHEFEFDGFPCEKEISPINNVDIHNDDEIVELREDAALVHATQLLHKLVANFSRYQISDYEYQCPLCDIIFKRRANLLSHLNEHVYNNNNEEDIEARLGYDPNKPFSSKPGRKKFQCDLCLKSFYTMLHLKRHMFTHDSDRHFTCNICSMKYKTKQILAIHVQTHTRPFSCQYCKKTFSQKGNLNSHLKRNHCNRRD